MKMNEDHEIQHEPVKLDTGYELDRDYDEAVFESSSLNELAFSKH